MGRREHFTTATYYQFDLWTELVRRGHWFPQYWHHQLAASSYAPSIHVLLALAAKVLCPLTPTLKELVMLMYPHLACSWAKELDQVPS